jgi:pilus assembly protein CpaF
VTARADNGWELLTPFLRPLVPFLEDAQVSEIMVNPDGGVFIEKAGRMLAQPDVQFPPAELEPAVERIARRLGGDITAAQPLFEGRLPDGSRVAAILPPCSVGGITFTIRKFDHRRFTAEELVRIGSLPQWAAMYLSRAILERRNILISGGTGSGKTTLLNVLTDFIPSEDRVVVLEDVSEIHLNKPNVVRLEGRPGQPGLPAITIADLLRASLRQRPDRILVGEVRGAEAYELLQALNTGHSGSISTLQADSAEMATARLTTCVMQRTTALSHAYIRSWIADSIRILVHLERRRGRRVLAQILRLDGYHHQADRYQFTEICHFEDPV